MARSGHTRRSFAEADLAFHLAIGVATANPLMRSPVDEPANQDATVQAHAAIVDAIEARDAPAAAAAMLEVIDVGVRRIGASRKKRKTKQ